MIKPKSIPLFVLLLATSILLVIVTALAVGIPAIANFRAELDRQAWLQVEQGLNSAQALMEAYQQNLDQLTMLTAQRPTLARLLSQDGANLEEYLMPLLESTELDSITICQLTPPGSVHVGKEISADLCSLGWTHGIYKLNGEIQSLWMISSQIVDGQSARVITSFALDEEFVRQLSTQTRLVHIFLASDTPIAASTGQTSLGDLDLETYNLEGSQKFSLEDTPYYSSALWYEQADATLLVALPVSEIDQARQSLTRALFASIFVTVAVGSLLAVVLARSMNRPLERLEQSAISFRRGDLTHVVPANTRVREVRQVAHALEDARRTLDHTMTELRSEKTWIEHLLESIVEGIITLDQLGRITFFSHGAEKIIGLSSSSALYHPVDEILHPVEGQLRFSQQIPAPGQRRKIAIQLADGKQVTLGVTGARFSPPQTGKGQIALVMRDISDEESLRRLLGDFMANITHEFRTPLSALAASVEILTDELPDLSTQEIRDLLVTLQLGVFNLQTLIDNLLDGASIETGQFRVIAKPAALTDALNESIRIMKPLFQKYGQRLIMNVPDDLPFVRIDTRRTQQVITNLLSNAIKNSPQGSDITLTVRQDAAMARVEIADQGPGIPPDYLANLFVRFVRIEPESGRADPGAGLGLSVVRAIVEEQGGQVGVENRPSGGACFWFTLPVISEGVSA